MAYAATVFAVATANVSTGAGGPGITSLDGVTLPGSCRILLTAQSLPKHNGVWDYGGSGIQLVRPATPDQYNSGNTLDNNCLLPITNGNTYASSVWGVDPSQVVVVDTTPHTLTRVVLPPVQAVAASTGSSINLSPASAMTSLDGVTFSSASNGAQGSDVILLKDQSPAYQNGLYWANLVTPYTLNRCTEPLVPARQAHTGGGTVNAHTHWALVTAGAPVVGTTALIFSRQFTKVNVRDWGARGTRQQQVLDHTMVSSL